MAVNLATAIVKIRGDSGALPADFNKAKGAAQRGVNRLQGAVNRGMAGATRGGNQFAGALGRVTSGLGSMGLGAAAVAGPLAAAGAALGAAAAGARSAIGFQDAMTRSLSIAGDVSAETRKEMELLARTMAVKFGRSASEMAESFFFLASAGLNVEQQLEALPIVTQFATAGNFKLQQATSLLNNTLEALGLAADDTAQRMANMRKLGDQLVATNVLADGTTEQFAEALSIAGGNLRAFGVDAAEALSILAVFASQNIKGSEAGNALLITLRELTNAYQKNRAEFEKASISVFDKGKLNLAGALQDLEKHLASMNAEQKKAALTTLGFQSEAQKFILPLIGVTDSLDKFEAKLRDVDGTMGEVADKQMQSFSKRLDKLGASMSDIGISVMTPLVDLLISIGEPLAAVARGFGQVNEALGNFPVLGPALFAITKQIEMWRSIFKSDFAQGLMEKVTRNFRLLGEIGTEAFNIIQEGAAKLFDMLGGNVVVDFFTSFGTGVENALFGWLDFSGNVLEGILAIARNWENVWANLPKFVSFAVLTASDIFGILRETIPQLIGLGLNKALGLMTDFLTTVGQMVISAGSSAINLIFSLDEIAAQVAAGALKGRAGAQAAFLGAVQNAFVGVGQIAEGFGKGLSGEAPENVLDRIQRAAKLRAAQTGIDKVLFPGAATAATRSPDDVLADLKNLGLVGGGGGVFVQPSRPVDDVISDLKDMGLVRDPFDRVTGFRRSTDELIAELQSLGLISAPTPAAPGPPGRDAGPVDVDATIAQLKRFGLIGEEKPERLLRSLASGSFGFQALGNRIQENLLGRDTQDLQRRAVDLQEKILNQDAERNNKLERIANKEGGGLAAEEGAA